MNFSQKIKSYFTSLNPDLMSELEKTAAFPEFIFKDWHQMGLMTAALPREHGGLGASMEELILIASELGRYDPGLFSSWIGNLLGVTAIVEFAHSELKHEVLESYVQKKELMSFCFTEPEAGTDAGALGTVFSPTQGGIMINGHKHLITNIQYASHYVVFARPNSSDKKSGISAFYIPCGHPGVTVGEPHEKLGHRLSNTGRIEFQKVTVGERHLLGAYHQGLEVLGRCISRTKTLIGAASVGLSKRAYDLAVEHLSQRVLYGQPLIKRSDIRAQLAELYTRIEAAWLLTQKAGRSWDQGDAVKEASMAKYYGAQVAVSTVSQAMELCGGLAYMVDHPLSRMYRDAKLFEIYEGASLVQLAIVAREVFKPAQPTRRLEEAA